MALRLQQVMIAASARTGKVLIHFPEVSLGKIYIAHWSATKGDPAARAERVTRQTAPQRGSLVKNPLTFFVHFQSFLPLGTSACQSA